MKIIMTIITNPLASLVKKGLIVGGFNGSKKNKLEEPLVDKVINEKHEKDEAKVPKVDMESGGLSSRHYYVLHSHARRVSATTTLCVFLTALLVTSLGILGGVYLYRQVSNSQVHRFRGWCKIPYPSFSLIPEDGATNEKFRAEPPPNSLEDNPSWVDNNDYLSRRTSGQSSGPFPESFFKEEFEIDDSNHYEKIEVPNFGRGRRGRFIHDFSANKTGIVDIDKGLCFVMSLDRDVVLPPRSLKDLVKKLQARYYEVDTRFVRRTMSIVIPAIKDYHSVGYYISQECSGIPTFLLKRVSTPIRKRRSVENSDDNGVHYYGFAGMGLMDIELVNKEVLGME